ncbi:hypothetical protein SEA_GODPHATHER_67 [Mycobacterium phage GodPhather]|uniref:DUF488 family protein n=1 Tax=Mycobacterium phage Jeon TaxID=2108123 RepID=A0A2P1JRJ1_9CAUD|nr:virion structural protein [Mycobacterium phage Jeon]AVO21768.1 hypothetical protein SEA_JEON_65 [Mycobacterium phage Jeon]QBP32640.1 hypothetical protein SEA_GODPHATHER_67 [Mycobacterium phage GodPhather]
MIEIATCSYGEFKPEMGVPIRTSVGTPKWFKGNPISWENVYPKYHWLHLPFDEYRRRYMALLADHGVEMLRGDIDHMVRLYQAQHRETPDRLVLLCFEKLSKPDAWCHRTLLAEYLTAELGCGVVELGALPGPTVDPDPTLF